MTSASARPASRDFRLFSYWVGLPPGRGVTMNEMMEAMDVIDPQAIRSSLTRLRKGRVPDPSRPGTYLRPLPVRWNAPDTLYYDLSNVSGDLVAAQVPGSILSGAFGQLLSRIATLESAMGSDGLVRSAERLLDDDETRMLIQQIPLGEIWGVQDRLLRIARARELLELQQGGGPQALPGA